VTITIEEGNRRLLVLADFLEKLPPERFDYSCWAGKDWGGAQDLSCGTTGCAMGWCPSIPEFYELGLRLFRDSNDDVGVKKTGMRTDDALASSFKTARVFFGLRADEPEWLFAPEHERWDTKTGETIATSPYRKAKPTEVAAHIRKFVASRTVAK